MNFYTFIKRVDAAATPVFDLGEFEDDQAARAHALRLLSEGLHYRAVEVWHGARNAATLERGPTLEQ